MYDFDNAVSEHKSNLIQSMKEFGEEKRIHHILKDIDLNICDYEFYFYKGQQSRQDEVDKLNTEIDELSGENKSLVGLVDFGTKKMEELHITIDELQLKLKSTKQSADEVIGAMSVSVYKRNKENESLNQVVDELQKRIDEALSILTDWNDQSYRDDSY